MMLTKLAALAAALCLLYIMAILCWAVKSGDREPDWAKALGGFAILAFPVFTTVAVILRILGW